MPTPEEKTKLARYVGFGGFPQALDTKYKDAYEKYGGVPSGELPVQTQAALKKLRFGLKGYDNYVQRVVTMGHGNACAKRIYGLRNTPVLLRKQY